MAKSNNVKRRKNAAVRRQSNLKNQVYAYANDLLKLTTSFEPDTASVKNVTVYRDILSILNKINEIELELSEPTEKVSRTDKVNKFMIWVKSHGAEFTCTPAEFDGFDLGLKADADLKQGDVMVSVPQCLMLHAGRMKGTPMDQFLSTDRMLQAMPNVALAMILLYERFLGEKSFWKPYIDILPTTYSTVLYFSMLELEELQCSPTLAASLKLIKNIARQYAYFLNVFSNTNGDPIFTLFRSKFTFDTYRWAVSTVMTRENTMPIGDDSLALIPLYDIFNHTNGTITTIYDAETERCQCTAPRAFQQGEQLFIFYGARSNADLFVHNGFVYNENEHDYFALRLGLSKSDPLHAKRSELLAKLSINANADFRIYNVGKPFDGQLLAYIRVFNMNEDQLAQWLESNKSTDLLYPQCAMDTVLEKKAWLFLKMRLKLILSSYKTSLEMDRDLIQNYENQIKNKSVDASEILLSKHKMLAIRLRAIEKRLLMDSVEFVEQQILAL